MNSPRDSFLTQRQRETIAAALTVSAGAFLVAVVVTILWAIGSFLSAFSSVLMPLAVAGILSMVVKPWHRWIRKNLRLPGPLAFAVLLLAAGLPLAGFIWFFGAALWAQVQQFLSELPTWFEKLRLYVSEHLPAVKHLWDKYDVGVRLTSIGGKGAGGFASFVQEVMARVFRTGLNLFQGFAAAASWAVVPVYMYFLLDARGFDIRNMEKHLPFLKPGTRKDVSFLVEQFVLILVAFFRGQLLIALLQGLLFAAGFALCGLKYGFLIGLLLGFLNVIPYLGSIVGLSGAIPLAYLQAGGGSGMVAKVVLVFAVVQFIEGYVLTPRIMGNKTGLHPLAIMVSILFWGSALNGISGMLLAIPLTAFLVVFWRLAKTKYIREIV